MIYDNANEFEPVVTCLSHFDLFLCDKYRLMTVYCIVSPVSRFATYICIS